MKWRKANKAKRFCHSCRNNGSCPYCRGSRTHNTQKQFQDDPIKEGMIDWEYSNPHDRGL